MLSAPGFHELNNPMARIPAPPSGIMPYTGGAFSSGVPAWNKNPAQGISDASFLDTRGKFFNDAIQSEVPINQQYYVDKKDWTAASFGGKQLIFMSRLPGIQSGSLYANSYAIESLSHMNYRLKHDPVFLQKYGNEPNCNKFLEDWGLNGALPQDPPSFAEANQQMVLNFCIGRRVRVTCPTMALKNESGKRETIRDGDGLYLVMRRFPLPDPLKASFAVTKRIYGEANLRGKRIAAEDVNPRSSKHNRGFENDLYESKYSGSKNNSSELEHKELPDVDLEGPKQYYWRIDAVTSRSRTKPHPHSYSSLGQNLDYTKHDPTKWHGHCFSVGLVRGCHGGMAWNTEIAAIAKQFLYPEEDNENYKGAQAELPDIDVLLGIE